MGVMKLLPTIAAALLSVCTSAMAQVPGELEQQLRSIGPVVNPAATAALYQARVTERAPAAGVLVERDVKYGPDERNLLDVFSTAEPKRARPVVVYVHGGGFVRGDRRTGPDSPFYDNIMIWAVRNGMVGVNMTYRLAPHSVWPSGPKDVARAVRWVQDHIAAYGGDPSRIFLLAHSTGAAHAAGYVADHRLYGLPDAGLAGAMLLSGVYRITPELIAQSGEFAQYFAGSEDYEKWSSVAGLADAKTPILIGVSELDPLRFKEQAEELTRAMCAAGKCPTVATFQGHSHMSEVYSILTEDRTVSDALLKFIQTHLN